MGSWVLKYGNAVAFAPDRTALIGLVQDVEHVTKRVEVTRTVTTDELMSFRRALLRRTPLPNQTQHVRV